MTTLISIKPGDRVVLRKPHPCGSFEWAVVRIGADIGLRCTTCKRRVMLPRTEVERQMRSFVSRAEHREPFGSADPVEILISPPPERN